MLETEHVGERDVKIQECPLEFTNSASMHHITFEEGELHVFVFIYYSSVINCHR